MSTGAIVLLKEDHKEIRRLFREFESAADAKARKNYAGTSPITRTSGTKRAVLARYARNRRLADAVHQQAFTAMRGSPRGTGLLRPAPRRRRQPPPSPPRPEQPPRRHPPGCLAHRTPYDETLAWQHQPQTENRAA